MARRRLRTVEKGCVATTTTTTTGGGADEVVSQNHEAERVEADRPRGGEGGEGGRKFGKKKARRCEKEETNSEGVQTPPPCEKEGVVEETSPEDELDFDEDIEEEELTARKKVATKGGGVGGKGQRGSSARRKKAEQQVDAKSREERRAKMREALERSKKESASVAVAVVSPGDDDAGRPATTSASSSSENQPVSEEDSSESEGVGSKPAKRKTKPGTASKAMGGSWSFLRPVTDSLLVPAVKKSKRRPTDRAERK